MCLCKKNGQIWCLVIVSYSNYRAHAWPNILFCWRTASLQIYHRQFDASGRHFRTSKTLSPQLKKKNCYIIRVGNPDEWCTQNYLPRDCLPVGNPEVGNIRGYLRDISHFATKVRIPSKSHGPHKFFWSSLAANQLTTVCATLSTIKSLFIIYRGGSNSNWLPDILACVS